MKKFKLAKTLLAMALIASLSACNDDDDSSDQTSIHIHPLNLEPLGDDFDYEGWIIVNGVPFSAGRFDIDENGVAIPNEFPVTNILANSASTYVLTIEPEVDDPPEPSATHILAGDFFSGSANISIDHAAAIGSDFTGASGSYILATPSNGNTTPTQGIWYLNASSGTPQASLNLPDLPEGWAYEGWIVNENGPISTGTFTNVAEADSDQGGPTAGPNPTPPFPGQDFVDPPMDLLGKNAVISVEPIPDNSPAPFTLKPLAGLINENNQTLNNNIVADDLPSGVVNIVYH